MDVRVFLCARRRRRNRSSTFPVALFSVYPHAIVIITEITKKNKKNKIRGVLPGQNSFLIFIGVYRQHYYEENRIIKIRNYL